MVFTILLLSSRISFLESITVLKIVSILLLFISDFIKSESNDLSLKFKPLFYVACLGLNEL